MHNFFFYLFFIMSNIKKNYFNPGRVEKVRKNGEIAKFSQQKLSQNPNYSQGYNKKYQQTFLGKKPIPQSNSQSTSYKKKGKPLPSLNLGSLGRLQKLKALAAKNSK